MENHAHELLFERDDSLGRQNGMAYSHRPFSPKLSRRVKIYTPFGYDHWVTVEIDSKIIRYNEDPPTQQIPFKNRLVSQNFEMVCQSVAGQVILRRLVKTEVDKHELDIRQSLAEWADKSGLIVENIDKSVLIKEQLRIDNWKHLLLFIDAARSDISPRLEGLLLAFVIKTAGVTLGHLQVEFSDWDKTVVVASIGRLLIGQKVTAKLNTKAIDRNLVIYPK